jgi:Ca2+-binding RTX toxin-like protein
VRRNDVELRALTPDTPASLTWGGITADLEAGSASGQGGDSLDGFERLVGSSHVDRLTGSTEANVLTGGKGGDFLFGLAGGDTPLGGPGDDSLNGGPGSDTCRQGPGTGPKTSCEH